jgi:MFS family permease
MAAGGALMGAASDPAALMLGRALSGAGAVALNVLVTKMVTDWFEGRELVTALGILITSWPLGIAIALIVLPGLADALSWRAAMHLPAALSAAALALVAACYRARPGGQANAAAGFRLGLTRREGMLATLAGLVWTFYNVGFILVLAFGPEFLVASGYSPRSASVIVSTVSWIIIPALPVGAWLAERIGRADATMAVCFLLAAAAIWSIASLGPSLALLAAIGLIFGPPGGLIMALPGEAVRPERRAVAMGLYYTCYYAGMGVLPTFAGWTRDAAGSAAAPLWFAGAMLILAGLMLLQFRILQRRPERRADA